MTTYTELTSNTARTTHVKAKLRTSDAWLLRGIKAIYAYQTADEQASEETKHHNGVGFNGADANFLTSLAKQVENGRTLSPKQIAAARRAMPKYAAQLVRIAQEASA